MIVIALPVLAKHYEVCRLLSVILEPNFDFIDLLLFDASPSESKRTIKRILILQKPGAVNYI